MSAPSRFAPATVTVAPEFEAPVATVVFAVPVVTANAFPLASASVVTDTVSVAAEALTSTPVGDAGHGKGGGANQHNIIRGLCRRIYGDRARTVAGDLRIAERTRTRCYGQTCICVRGQIDETGREPRRLTSTPSPTLLTSKVDEPLRVQCFLC